MMCRVVQSPESVCKHLQWGYISVSMIVRLKCAGNKTSLEPLHDTSSCRLKYGIWNLVSQHRYHELSVDNLHFGVW